MLDRGGVMEKLEKATFGGGCFWCTEAVFQRVNGVTSVVPGYAGGNTPNPTYKEVITGKTGHVQVVQVTYDIWQITYNGLLDVFWQCHDPMSVNRQGQDKGPHYRSIILYHDEGQRKAAKKSKAKMSRRLSFQKAMRFLLIPAIRGAVTEIAPVTDFYPAEEDHHDFYNRYPDIGYCVFVIDPKLRKLGLD